VVLAWTLPGGRTTMVSVTLGALPPPTWPGVLGRWELDPGVLAAVIASGAAYQAAWRRSLARRAGGARRAAFLAGLAVVVLALCSPIAAYADELFSAHMAEHLLLTLVAAPLLVAGRPVTTVLGLVEPRRRHRLLRLRRHRLVVAVGHPLVGWVAFGAVAWVVHFSGLYERSLTDPVVHGVEHLLLFGSALLFWRPVLGPTGGRHLSHPMRLLYLAVAMPQETFLALAIYTSSSPLYRAYQTGGRHWGPSPLADQRAAGGLMWVVTELFLLVAVLVTANAWAGHEGRVTARREALEDAEAALAPR
jgi:putative membrane protein